MLTLVLVWAGRQVPYRQTLVVGAVHAVEADLQNLAGLDSLRRVYDLDPVLVADRVVRHPWVREATVTRWPTGTVVIGVVEREPVALAIEDERPAYYLDAHGFRMPPVAGAVYDVPLLHGLADPYHPIRPVTDLSTREWLALLPTLDPDLDALLSDLEWRSREGWWLHVVPPHGRQAIPVQLGHTDFATRLRGLHTVWQDAVVHNPQTRFEWIDLRFEGQVITKETPRP